MLGYLIGMYIHMHFSSHRFGKGKGTGIYVFDCLTKLKISIGLMYELSHCVINCTKLKRNVSGLESWLPTPEPLNPQDRAVVCNSTTGHRCPCVQNHIQYILPSVAHLHRQ